MFYNDVEKIFTKEQLFIFCLANMQGNNNHFNISRENRWFVPCSGIS